MEHQQTDIFHGVSLQKMSEYIPGDVVIAVKHLDKLAHSHGIHIGLLALLNGDDTSMTVMLLWPPISESNNEVKATVIDAVMRCLPDAEKDAQAKTDQV